MKRTELRRLTPLVNRKPMPRGEATLARITRLKPRSAKRAAIAPERAELVRTMLAEQPSCQIRWDDGCQGRAVDVDEIVSRAQGGSILDPTNCRSTCRYCHDKRHHEPAEADRRGIAPMKRPAP